MKRVMMATAVAALVSVPAVTVPAYAQSFAPGPGIGDIQASRPAPTRMHRGVPHHRSARRAYASFAAPEPTGRDAAIRDCNAAAAKTYAVRDSNWSISAYRACMVEHGQPE
jgi:hypothetical protein